MRPGVGRATAAVADLLRDSEEYRDFFRRCCEMGALRLRSQARQFRDELRDQGRPFPLADVEDSLMHAARKVLPRTPAAEWDPEWAASLCADAMARISERVAAVTAAERDRLDLSGQDRFAREMAAASLANDPARFREAIWGWEAAAVEALEAATREEAGVIARGLAVKTTGRGPGTGGKGGAW